MAVDLHPDIVKAIREFSGTRLGRKYDRFTRRQYHLPGWKVLAKTNAGEAGGKPVGAAGVSSAGARGPFQFISSTRNDFRSRYGVDPWRSNEEAVKAAALHHLTRGGIRGYNPGMPTYQNYILGQRLNASDRRALRGGGGKGKYFADQDGQLNLAGRTSTTVKLPQFTVPGRSFSNERSAARMELLLGGKIDMDRLLEYKRTVNDLRDIPEQKVYGDLQVSRRQGQGISVATKGAPVAVGGGRGGGGALGKVQIRPGADRAGVPTSRAVVEAGRRIAGIAGRSIIIGTGTNHSRLTVNGNVSDHWDGHAADVPATGRSLTRLGQSALIAAGMSPARAKRVKGGLFNVNGWQIIFNTDEGGNHYNHLHYRPPRGR